MNRHCPRCGSGDHKSAGRGRLRCNHCGRTWNPRGRVNQSPAETERVAIKVYLLPSVVSSLEAFANERDSSLSAVASAILESEASLY